MCAEYTLQTSDRDLSELLGRELTMEGDSAEYDLHARVYARGPIVRMADDGTPLLVEAQFSLLPRGGRVPFTANTRLDDWDTRKGKIVYAYQRPTWREAFLKRRCLIPVSAFLEPIYTGAHAGKMMAFSAPGGRPLLIAGIWQETLDVATGEIYAGFSMMTDYAHPTVREVGHHRTVILLETEDALRWIKPEPIEGAAGVEFLVKRAAEPPLEVRAVREMKNWKARVKNAELNAAAEFEVEALVQRVRRGPLRG